MCLTVKHSNQPHRDNLQEDPEVRDFKNAAADTAHSVKESVKPDDQVSGKSSSEKTVMESVSSMCAASGLLALSICSTSAETAGNMTAGTLPT